MIFPIFKSRIILLSLLSVVTLSSCFNDDDYYINYLNSLPLIPDDSVKVIKIWDNDKYCAFTSLVKYQGEYYCAFREGANHNSSDGSIRILKSSDVINWKEAYYLSLSDYDLRDPNLSVMPDGRLMMICGRQVQDETQTVVCFLDGKDSEFSNFQEVNIPNEVTEKVNWIWRVMWINDVCYGVRYGGDHADLLKSNDGLKWDFISTIPLVSSEVQLGRMRNGDMVALARTRGNGIVCYSSYPYQKWNIQYSNILLQGQSFVVTTSDRIICASRSIEGTKTTLYCNRTQKSFAKLYNFPSGGDTSYAGMILEDDRLLISYYSSHISPSDIFIAEIPVKCFIDRGIYF